MRRACADMPTSLDRRRKAVGRPVVIGLGTLIIILLLVAYFF